MLILPFTKHLVMRTNSLFALLAGAAVGVAAGILLAPDKGSETRRKLKEASEGGAEKVRQETENIREQMSALKDMLAKEGSHLKNEAKVKIIEQLRKLEEALSRDNDIEEQSFEEA